MITLYIYMHIYDNFILMNIYIYKYMYTYICIHFGSAVTLTVLQEAVDSFYNQGQLGLIMFESYWN